MKKSDNPADAFKKALAEATKVMADDAELNVSYSVDPAGLSGDSMRLPQVSRRMNEATQSTLSSFADGPRVGRSAQHGDMCSVLVRSMGQTRSQTHYSRHILRRRPDVR